MKSNLATLAVVSLIAVANQLPAVVASTQKEPLREHQPAQQNTRYGIGYKNRTTDQKQSNLTTREHSDDEQPRQKERAAESQQ